MLDNISYKVFEDNAGGLYLFVFDNDIPIFTGNGYEHVRGVLTENIADLNHGAHPDDWEINKNDPQADYDWFMNQESYNYNLIAEGYDDQTRIYKDQMGDSGLFEFNTCIM